jgi:hypothetical protein
MFKREDTALRGRAVELGYKVYGDVERGDSLTFNKGRVHIWRIRSGWQCAELIPKADGEYFVNHRPYTNLKDALEKES